MNHNVENFRIVVAGHPVHIRELDGCFQTSVAGKNYVSTTMEGLHQAIQHHHPSAIMRFVTNRKE